MTTKELRIGNFIQTPGGLLPLDEIGYKDGAGYMKIEGRNIGYYLDTCNPIPLTEEWLLKLRFVLHKDGETWMHKTMPFVIVDNGYGYFKVMQSGNLIGIQFQYVHQLQNLCFALTGKELEVKP